MFFKPYFSKFFLRAVSIVASWKTYFFLLFSMCALYIERDSCRNFTTPLPPPSTPLAPSRALSRAFPPSLEPYILPPTQTRSRSTLGACFRGFSPPAPLLPLRPPCAPYQEGAGARAGGSARGRAGAGAGAGIARKGNRRKSVVSRRARSEARTIYPLLSLFFRVELSSKKPHFPLP